MSYAFRSAEIREPDPKAAPCWFVPCRTLTEARACALDARMDGSAAVTLIQQLKDGTWTTIETCFARGLRPRT